MDKMKLLKWVQDGLPVDVKGKKMFLHYAAVLDPSGEFCLLLDKNPYDPNHDGSVVSISSADVKDVTPML
jgi:hypothetical protein